MTSAITAVKRATVALALFDESNNQRPFQIVGSGFCVHPRGVIVTCAHVLSSFMSKSLPQILEEHKKTGGGPELMPLESKVPYAVFFVPKSPEELMAFPVRTEVAMGKTNFDLGMVRVSSHAAFSSGYPTLDLMDYEQIAEGMEIGTCGFPLGNHLYTEIGTVTSSFTKGIVSSIIPAAGAAREYLRGFQLDLTATNGNSGGPVFEFSTGKVFGVLQRGVSRMDGSLLAGLTKAEPVYPLFDNNSLEALLKASPNALPR